MPSALKSPPPLRPTAPELAVSIDVDGVAREIIEACGPVDIYTIEAIELWMLVQSLDTTPAQGSLYTVLVEAGNANYTWRAFAPAETVRVAVGTTDRTVGGRGGKRAPSS